MNKTIRIKELVRMLNMYCDAYYNANESLISDKEFDALYDELLDLEKETGIILSNSPTQHVGYEVKSELQKVKHSHLMMSLDKTKDVNELIKFIGTHKCVLMNKMDGCFIGDTRITMANYKTKKIKDIKIGDEVLSYDLNGKICTSKVKNIYNNGLKTFDEWVDLQLYDYLLKSNKYHVTCTKNHKIYTPNGYKEAGNLNVGDYVYVHNKKISQDQSDILLGILLGDGWFVNRSKLKEKSLKNKLEIHYSKTKSKHYDDLIYQLQKKFITFNSTISYRTSGYSSKENNMVNLNLGVIDVPDYFCNSKNHLRCGFTFTEEICKHLSPLALAMFYLDDGSKIQCQNDGFDVYNVKNTCLLHTNRHKKENVKILSDYLKSIGVSNNIRFEKCLKNYDFGDGYIIYIDAEGTEVFFDMIAKYIPKEFRKIKLGLKDKWQNCECFNFEDDDSNYSLIETQITNIKNGFRRSPSQSHITRKTAYDLEIENTHCYFANGFAVHNCTMLLTYENGELIQAETRGNATVGELVTHNAKVFENIPLHIDYSGHLEVEGEAIITYNDFDSINDTIKDPDKKYKNPRNLASGSVRQLDSKITKERHLRFILWKVPAGMDHINSFKERLENARGLGFDVVPFVTVNSAEEINGAIDGLKNVACNLSYPIDGLVITYNDIKYGLSLGMTDKFPRHSFAFKFYDEEYETTLQDVEWTIGKSGQLTPTAVFEPVEIDGTEVSRASLHNVSIFKAFDMHVGDTIMVYKANQIIPQIKENLSKGSNTGTKLSIPQKCPYCGEPTIVVKENDSEVLMCLNAQCQGKLLGELCAFVGKKAHDIKGLSEATLSLMIHTGMVHSPIDLYHLEDKRKELTYFPKMGSKKVDNILKAIEESRNTTLEKFIVGLNIPLIGSRAAKDIAKHEEIRTKEAKLVKPINTFIVDAAENYDFTHIEGLGIERNNSIHNYFKENYDYVCAMASLFKFPEMNLETENISTSTSLEGKKFCITGKLQKFANRDALVADIEAKGGKVVSGVTKATDYLITNDKTSGSSKNKKAAELSIPIISEEEYINLS